MAIGAILNGNTLKRSGSDVPSSTRSDWVVANENLKATAATATELRKPLTFATSHVRVVRVPQDATRVLIRPRYEVAVVSMTTAPAVKLYSIFGEASNTGTESAPVFATDGTVRTLRIDASGVQATASTTLTITPATDQADGTYGYGDITDMDGYDLKGGSFLLVLTGTAGVINSGSGAIDAQVLFLN